MSARETLVGDDFKLSDDGWKMDFTDLEVEEQLRKLNSSKASGSDNIPNKIYSLLAHFLATPLRKIFESSISQRVFPSQWKNGIVVPIPKTNPPRLDKLRSITLLPTPSKVLERLFLRRMFQHLEPLYSAQQHAYRKNTSTTTALIHIYDTATKHFDDLSKSGFAIICLDFSKAFDLLNHDVLLQKLTNQLPAGCLLWLQSYLTRRSFRVKIQGRLSKPRNILAGVPQGSVLGPVLFAALVGDLAQCTAAESTTIVQYADDASVIMPFSTSDTSDII